MKLLVTLLALLALPVSAYAQSSVSGAASGSIAKNTNLNASMSGAAGNTINYNANGGKVEYGGSYRLENVPGVTPPGFSSGHPCAYAPVSIGVGVVGAGASVGGQIIDDACLLAQMGYTREAMAMIAARNKSARSALQATGQVASSPVASASSKATPRAPVLLSKCEKVGNEVRIGYTAAGRKDKATAKASCLRSLGY